MERERRKKKKKKKELIICFDTGIRPGGLFCLIIIEYYEVERFFLLATP